VGLLDTRDRAAGPLLSKLDTPGAKRHQLGQAALSGFVWSYASFILTKLLVFGTTILLARMLTPEDFGVVCYALVFIGYLELARDLGIGQALIARPHIDRRTASTAFYISAGWGLLVAGSAALAAPLLGELFNDLRVVPVARLLTVGFLLSALGSTHDALLYRSLAFNRRAIPDITRSFVKGLVSVALAMNGFGYWSLVFGQVAGQVSFCAAVWTMQPFRPSLEWDSLVGRRLLEFGSAVVAVHLVAALLSYLTTLVAGRELGAAALGLYTLASAVPNIVLNQTYSLLSTVLFPIYARLRDDQEGLRRGYLMAQRCMTLFALPAGAGLAIIAPLFVTVFYGPRWAEAAPVMQILAVGGAISSIGWQAGDITRAVGRARLQLALVLVTTVVVAPMLPYATHTFGLVGLTVARTSGSVLAVALSTVMVRRLVKLPIGDALWAVGPAAAAALAVSAAAGGFLLATQEWSDTVRLIGATTLGIAAYAAAVSIVGQDVLRLLIARIQPAGAAPDTAAS
jgi:lipopolysaccharide exporter